MMPEINANGGVVSLQLIGWIINALQEHGAVTVRNVSPSELGEGIGFTLGVLAQKFAQESVDNG